MDDCLVAVLDEVGKQSKDFGLHLQGYARTTEFLALPGKGIGTKRIPHCQLPAPIEGVLNRTHLSEDVNIY